MKELGMTLVGCMVIFTFFTLKIYPDLEYSGYGSGSSCTGECYEEYVRINGTTVDILRAKQELAKVPSIEPLVSKALALTTFVKLLSKFMHGCVTLTTCASMTRTIRLDPSPGLRLTSLSAIRHRPTP